MKRMYQGTKFSVRCGWNEVSSSNPQIRVAKICFSIVGYIDLGGLHVPMLGGLNILYMLFRYIDVEGAYFWKTQEYKSKQNKGY
jgi:hypothetical protein